MDWVKIAETFYHPMYCSAQLTLGSHATITLGFDINEYPEYRDPLLKIYDTKISGMVIDTKEYQAFGCCAKTLEVNFNKTLVISFHCDVIGLANIQERRDQKLEDFLNSTENN